MGANTKIEWADHTFNPWVGCKKVSAACENCYAETWANRFGEPALWQGVRRRTSPANWQLPVKWNRDAKAANAKARITHPRVFCASLADVFEDHPDLGAWRRDLFGLITQTPALDWLLLTKRPENIARQIFQAIDNFGTELDGIGEPNGLDLFQFSQLYPNVWLGTTVEHQRAAEQRIPQLLNTGLDPVVRFLSVEPLLGPVDLSEWLGPNLVNWVIVGGESGAYARPMHLEWVQSLRHQCARAGVPFFFKQWGEYAPNYSIVNAPPVLLGKQHAGRKLGGCEYNEVPVIIR